MAASARLSPSPTAGGKRRWRRNSPPTFQPGHGIFSPGTPLVPPEPEKTRLWDFPIGVNTILTPRAYEPVSFTELRALAEAHDITRLAIETRKDQIEKLDWAIKPKGGKPRDAKRP